MMASEDEDHHGQHRKHRHRASAYVQHLAEACSIIVNDARWRTAMTTTTIPPTISTSDNNNTSNNNGSIGESLFSAEKGDDLSAVKAFASMYDDEDRDYTMTATAKVANGNDNNIDDDIVQKCHDSRSGTAAEKKAENMNGQEEDNEVFERAMHLYSRMFVRKGPWFDLADLYGRYYAPKSLKATQMNLGVGQEDEVDDGVTIEVEEIFPNNESSLDSSFKGGANGGRNNYACGEGEKINKFFKPRRSLSALSSSSSLLRSKNNGNTHSSNDGDDDDNDDSLSSHRIALEYLFRDIYYLLSMGLLRSFRSEYECGHVSGHVDVTSGRGTFLSAAERRDVLIRCGGGGKKLAKTTARRSLGTATTIKTTTKTTIQNEILNQMQSQQSLLASFFVTTSKSGRIGGGEGGGGEKKRRASSSNTAKLLPVAKHVDAVLLRKLAVRVATTLASGAFAPPCKSDIERASHVVKAALHASRSHHHRRIKDTKDISDDASDDDVVICLGNGGSFGTAFRLHEVPLKTLRRCMRLFLCAGGGPGAMRGDGSNGWMSVLDDEVRTNNDDSCQTSPPPSSSRWHNVMYPGLSSRLGLEFYELSRCYTPVPSRMRMPQKTPQLNLEKEECIAASKSLVSSASIGPFHCYLDFQLWELGVELRSFIDRVYEAYELEKQQSRRRNRGEREFSVGETPAVDWKNSVIHLLTGDGFVLLTEDGRRDFVESILALCFHEAAHSPKHIALNQAIYNLCPLIEADILSLSTDTIIDNDDDADDVCDGFASDTERLIAAYAVICRRILELRVEYPSSMLTSLFVRPWLRHMSFDAILAYILWDCVPIFERRGHHSLAVSILQTILFGRDIFELQDVHQLWSERLNSEPFVECLLPRRNRGKACERLLIDMTHTERRAKKISKKGRKRSIEETKQFPVQSLCNVLLEKLDSIPFCSLRNVARRSKAPLPQTYERSILLIRPIHDDWSPITDCAVANSITMDSSDAAAGKRCSFVGWEMHDYDGEVMDAHRSLNVEELAMEEYHSGRLPRDQELKGQWAGWHDEGGHVRALFRILCLQHHLIECSNLNEQTTIILTPYQNSPHDLHVGCFQTVSGSQVRGFYERRRTAIEKFLVNLSNFDASGLSKMVYDAIKTRWDRHVDDRSRMKDPRLLKDVTELKTLSMIAGALGPVGLARIFRTLCFDYRHWSGGLPDLFLVRAFHCDLPTDGDSSSLFINLADWIGEGFSQNRIDEKNLQCHTNMLADRDDEFLGQPKSADSFPSQQQNYLRKNNRFSNSQLPSFSNALEFVHGEKRVRAECMFVEVKSANDRLSERQEDWLSILESSTTARVCKFTKKLAEGKPIKE